MEDRDNDPKTMVTSKTPHLNLHDLEIQSTLDRGRGVYASRSIPNGTLIEISPVLLFEKDEYALHGRHTVLDHYTFVWGDGKMALPLGLGSLFNHSSSPNINYIKKKEDCCIEYWTTRTISPGEELCIFYGHKLWFTDSSVQDIKPSLNSQEKDEEDILACIDL